MLRRILHRISNITIKQTVIGFSVLVEVLVVLGCVFFTLYSIDGRYLKETRLLETSVVSKHHKYAESGEMLNGKTKPSYSLPERWTLCFHIEDEAVCARVDDDYFESVSEGQLVRVEYGHGQFSNKIHITKIDWFVVTSRQAMLGVNFLNLLSF